MVSSMPIKPAQAKKVWSKDMMAISGMRKVPDWGFAGSPYVLGNLLLIEAGATYALDKNSGEIIWKSKDYRPAYGSPISLKVEKIPILPSSRPTAWSFSMQRW
jgi:outer membrane protein assembly factor BamB